MKPVITVQNMRESDAYTIREFVPSKELMYRAAMGVYLATEWKGTIGILVGAGNNGGDGYALACILADKGIPSVIYRVSEKFSEDGRYYYDMALEKGVEIVMFTEDADLSGYDILVDCMLGTGFSGEVRGLYRAAIQGMNDSQAYTICVDINSGMNGDTGLGDLVVKADLTVTIGFLKTGFFLAGSHRHTDKLVVTDIGIRLLEEEYWLTSPEETGWDLSDALELPVDSLLGDAVEQAKEKGSLVCIPGKTPLVTDGQKVCFLGQEPETILSLGEA
ncbi:MAG: NAD(P)H-hydrate epimerase [Ruminiclostridium sp.]|nr:NAD(P)H-hydrate epimerase [Ruminiclostridium sp.]